MFNYRPSIKAIIIYWLALLGLTACPSFFIVTWFVLESYSRADTTFFGLGLPLILMVYVLVSLIARWMRRIPGRATPYAWLPTQILILMAVVLLFTGVSAIIELRTFPKYIFSSQKDGLLWQTTLIIWLAGVTLGTAVFALPHNAPPVDAALTG